MAYSRPYNLRKTCLILLLYFGVSTASQAQHIWIDPRVDSRVTVTDNALLTLKDRQSDAVFNVSPGLNVRIQGGRTRGSIDYNLDYLYYASDGGTEVRQSLFGTLDSEVWKDHLTLGARASVQQQFLDQRGSLSNNFANRTSNRRLLQTYTGSAILKGGMRDFADWRVNYRYGISKTPADNLNDETLTVNFSDTTSHELNASIGSGERFNYVSWRVFANSRRVIRSLDVNDFRTEKVSAELTYKFNRFIAVTGSVNVSSNDFQSATLSQEGFGWEAGFRWTPGRKLDISLSTGREGKREIWYAALQYFFSARVVFNGNYQDLITANTLVTNNNIQSFRSDPTGGLIDGQGRPVDEVDPRFSYSDVDFRRRVAQGNFTWRHKRTEVSFGGNAEWRTFDNESGTAASWGLSGRFKHKMDRHTTLSGRISYLRSSFEGSTRVDNYIQASLDWTKTISRQFKAVIGYKHSDRQSNEPGADLEENSLTFYIRGTF